MDEVNTLIEISKKMFIVMYFLDENYSSCNTVNTNVFLENFIKEGLDIYEIDLFKCRLGNHLQILLNFLDNYQNKEKIGCNNSDVMLNIARFKKLLTDIKIR